MNFNQQIKLETRSKKILGDLYTPIGIYLRLRDHYRDTILLESAGNQNAENNFSFIGVNAIAGIEITNLTDLEVLFPLSVPQKMKLNGESFTEVLKSFQSCFQAAPSQDELAGSAQGLYGYTAYDAVQSFSDKNFKASAPETEIPLVRYRLYQYVIAINHFNDEMTILENAIEGLPSDAGTLETLINQKTAPTYPFVTKGEETSNQTDAEFGAFVQRAKEHTESGELQQIVLSRRYEQSFAGDEFNVYRALRNINPSPYLFFFDYGDYKIFGSSPESQLIVKKHKAYIHPIAGTFRRTGNADADLELAHKLKNDHKENLEHEMLVDLAEEDLGVLAKNVQVSKLKEIHFYSHVIHMVSEVTADVPEEVSPFEMIATTFPQGTLSGAPKPLALELIDKYEKTSRGYYGGCIGFVGFDQSCNQAIMIRTFLSKKNRLFYQAGAGIVVESKVENEVQEVKNKLNALKVAIQKAAQL